MSFPRYEAYKHSGVEWLGKVPKHWEVLALKRRFRIEGGSTPAPDEANWNGDIIWVTPADLSNLNSLYISSSKRSITSAGLTSCSSIMLPIESIILSTRAPIGSLAVAKSPLCTNQGCKGLIPSDKACSIYFAYVLLIAESELNNRGKGTTFLEISGDELSRFDVPSPTISEQSQIARFLDHETARIDALIAEQQRLIELLKEKRQAVISHAVTKGLDPTVLMKDSGVEWLGEVPDHWEVTKLAYISTRISSGKTPSGGAERYCTSGILFIRSQNVYDEGLRLNDCVFIDEETDQDMAGSRVKPLDVLFNITGASIGRSCLIPVDFDVANVNQHVCAIRLESPSLHAPWVAMAMKSMQTKIQVDVSQTGAAREGLNFEQLANFWICLPPANERTVIIDQVYRKVSHIDVVISESIRITNLLQERRSALISAAVTGKIDVRNWQPSTSSETEPTQVIAKA